MVEGDQDRGETCYAAACWAGSARPALGVGLAEGVSELDVAAPFEVYATSFAARTVPIAATPAVTTRHGLRLIAAPAGATAPGWTG